MKHPIANVNVNQNAIKSRHEQSKGIQATAPEANGGSEDVSWDTAFWN